MSFLRNRGNLLLLPSLAIFGVLFAAPISLFFVISFWRVKLRRMIPDFTFENYVETFNEYFEVAVFTFTIALTIAVLTTVLAFGFAYIIRFKAGRFGPLLLFIALVTLFGGYLMKVYAWKTILGTDGILNTLLLGIGVISEPLTIFLYNPGSVVVTLVHFLLPLAILPIFASLRGIKDITLEAARDLGANPRQIFLGVLLPQCRQGLLAAFAFTFLIAAGDYVTPRFLGGPHTSMLGNFIQSQFGLRFDWPLGAAMSFTILLVSLGMIVAVRVLLWLPRSR
jgi:spermidine/putrescine transport system permease protein